MKKEVEEALDDLLDSIYKVVTIHQDPALTFEIVAKLKRLYAIMEMMKYENRMQKL
jgi:hypothetical protein